MATRRHSPMAERPSASSTQLLASPSPSSSSRPPCRGSWCTVHGGPSPTSTGSGVCPSRWWPSSTPACSPSWPWPASCSSPPPSSLHWRKTGTSWSLSTSASSLSPPLAWETTSPGRLPTRGSESCTKWASQVSAVSLVTLVANSGFWQEADGRTVWLTHFLGEKTSHGMWRDQLLYVYCNQIMSFFNATPYLELSLALKTLIKCSYFITFY